MSYLTQKESSLNLAAAIDRARKGGATEREIFQLTQGRFGSPSDVLATEMPIAQEPTMATDQRMGVEDTISNFLFGNPNPTEMTLPEFLHGTVGTGRMRMGKGLWDMIGATGPTLEEVEDTPVSNLLSIDRERAGPVAGPLLGMGGLTPEEMAAQPPQPQQQAPANVQVDEQQIAEWASEPAMADIFRQSFAQSAGLDPESEALSDEIISQLDAATPESIDKSVWDSFSENFDLGSVMGALTVALTGGASLPVALGMALTMGKGGKEAKARGARDEARLDRDLDIREAAAEGKILSARRKDRAEKVDEDVRPSVANLASFLTESDIVDMGDVEKNSTSKAFLEHASSQYDTLNRWWRDRSTSAGRPSNLEPDVYREALALAMQSAGVVPDNSGWFDADVGTPNFNPQVGAQILRNPADFNSRLKQAVVEVVRNRRGIR